MVACLHLDENQHYCWSSMICSNVIVWRWSLKSLRLEVYSNSIFRCDSFWGSYRIFRDCCWVYFQFPPKKLLQPSLNIFVVPITKTKQISLHSSKQYPSTFKLGFSQLSPLGVCQVYLWTNLLQVRFHILTLLQFPNSNGWANSFIKHDAWDPLYSLISMYCM